MGKSRPHIANHIRLLSLPDEIQNYISQGKLTMGHGRALLGLKAKKNILPLAEKSIKEQLNVRQLEELIQKQNKNVSRETKKAVSNKDVFIRWNRRLFRQSKKCRCHSSR